MRALFRRFTTCRAQTRQQATDMGSIQEIFARELAEHKVSSLGIGDYLYCAARTIQRERAEGWKRRCTPIFEFARYVKAHPEVKTGADGARRGILKWLERLAKDDAMTVEELFDSFFGTNLEEGMTQFFAVWDDVRFPKGYPPLDWALENNRLHPIEIDNPPTPGHEKLIGVCYHLDCVLGGKAIALPQKLLGKKLGVAQRTISYWIKWAVQQGYLARHRRHKHVPGGNGRGAMYSFNSYKFAEVRSGSKIRLKPFAEISNAELDAMRGVR
jgi:hypothetical protein